MIVKSLIFKNIIIIKHDMVNFENFHHVNSHHKTILSRQALHNILFLNNFIL